MTERSNDPGGPPTPPAAARAPRRWGLTIAGRVLLWALTAGCFYFLYSRIAGAAAFNCAVGQAPPCQSALEYVVAFFAGAQWLAWLAIMIPYSVFFFLVDAHVTWRVIRWFNAPNLRLRDMLPIRASAYILSLVNEQVGKGAMTLYLLRRHQTPGWQTLSSMIMLGSMEIFYLLAFAGVGTLVYYDLVVAASTKLPLDVILPTVVLVALAYLPLHIAYFRGHLLKSFRLRELPVLRAFREAQPHHYLLVIGFKIPALLGAVVVYTLALGLFNVTVSFGQMAAFLPVIFLAAALPLPFRAGSLVLWTVLFPGYPEVAVFSLVMHSFFLLFNATIGLAFLPVANRQLFDQGPPPATPAGHD